MSRRKFVHITSSILVSTLCLAAAPAYALEWQNLWSTPEQRAAKQVDQQQYDELIDQAPDALWRGIGEYRTGDYAAAIESFGAQRDAANEAASTTDLDQAMYNQANAYTLNENYSEAISVYEELLTSSPGHTDALHNLEIAKQLLEQQEQEQQEQEQSEQEQSQDQESGDEQNEESSEEQQSDSQENSDEQEPSDSDQSSDSEEPSEGDAESQDQAEQDAQAAEAMAAEQAKAQLNEDQMSEPANDTATEAGMAPADPLTEKEQANEQWLRQIPDDPAGLLERKLQNRHFTDFPKVEDSVNPW